MSDTISNDNSPEQIDLGHVIQGIVNMKTELEEMKLSIQEDKQKLRSEIKKEYGEILKKQDALLEEIISSLEQLQEQTPQINNIPEPMSTTSDTLTLEQQQYISSLQTLTTRVFEALGDVKARLEAMEGDLRELDNRVILQNERIENMKHSIELATGQFEKNSSRWFELSKYQVKVVLIALGVVGAAVGVKELFDFLPQLFGW